MRPNQTNERTNHNLKRRVYLAEFEINAAAKGYAICLKLILQNVKIIFLSNDRSNLLWYCFF